MLLEAIITSYLSTESLKIDNDVSKKRGRKPREKAYSVIDLEMKKIDNNIFHTFYTPQKISEYEIMIKSFEN